MAGGLYSPNPKHSLFFHWYGKDDTNRVEMDRRHGPAMVSSGALSMGKLQVFRSALPAPTDIACAEYSDCADAAPGAFNRVWWLATGNTWHRGPGISPINANLHGYLFYKKIFIKINMLN